MSISKAVSHNAQGKEISPPIDPRGGTMELVPDAVRVHYETAGVSYEVVYAIVGPTD